MALEERGPDWFGRSIGLIGFFAGIAMLVIVLRPRTSITGRARTSVSRPASRRVELSAASAPRSSSMSFSTKGIPRRAMYDVATSHAWHHDAP